jgi:beta-glucanase (GH16 family)
VRHLFPKFSRRIVASLVLGALVASSLSARAAWQLVWSDEFDGSSIASTNWVFETGNNNGWGNQEREYYTSRATNAYVANGVLHIVAQQESYGGFPFTSARMKSQNLFSKKYGRIEFRAKLPQGLGYWPALWMLGTNISSVGWPACGEIDVMENKGSSSTQVGGTIHYADVNNNDVYQAKSFTLPTPGDSVTNFHTYAIQWTSNSIVWQVDGQTAQTWTSWGAASGTYAYPAPFNKPFFLIMNVAVGGQYLGSPSDSTIIANTVFPGEMQVDYVRVYDDLPAVTPPDAPTGLNASPGNAKVYLSWDASSSSATGYKVKRSTVSGNSYTILASPTTNSYTDTSAANCSTYFYVVSATNSFGESTNSTEQSAALGAFAVAVNSGGGAAGQFSADAYFSGGTQAAPTANTIDTSAVTAPAPQAVYQTERYGSCTYTFTGLIFRQIYKVRLHFAEYYWSAVGQRQFNVFINGTQVLTNFDIIAVAGAANKATIQEFMASALSGQLVIQFTTVIDNAKCSGIEVLLPQPAVPVASNNSPLYSGMTLNLSASTLPGATYNWTGPNGFASVGQNPSLAAISTNGSGIYTVRATVGTCASGPATTLVTVNPPPSLSIQRSSPNLTLAWPVGILQSVTNLSGTWADVPGANTPYTNTSEGPQQFFRLRLQ